MKIPPEVNRFLRETKNVELSPEMKERVHTRLTEYISSHPSHANSAFRMKFGLTFVWSTLLAVSVVLGTVLLVVHKSLKYAQGTNTKPAANKTFNYHAVLGFQPHILQHAPSGAYLKSTGLFVREGLFANKTIHSNWRSYSFESVYDDFQGRELFYIDERRNVGIPTATVTQGFAKSRIANQDAYVQSEGNIYKVFVLRGQRQYEVGVMNDSLTKEQAFKLLQQLTTPYKTVPSSQLMKVYGLSRVRTLMPFHLVLPKIHLHGYTLSQAVGTKASGNPGLSDGSWAQMTYNYEGSSHAEIVLSEVKLVHPSSRSSSPKGRVIQIGPVQCHYFAGANPRLTWYDKKHKLGMELGGGNQVSETKLVTFARSIMAGE